MIYHDYECPEHGCFESGMPDCPVCGKAAEMVFLKAPGTRSETTRFKDRFLDGYAKQHGLSDLSNRGGNSIMSNQHRTGGMTHTVPIDEKTMTAGGISLAKGQDNFIHKLPDPPRINVIAAFDPETGKGWRK